MNQSGHVAVYAPEFFARIAQGNLCSTAAGVLG